MPKLTVLPHADLAPEGAVLNVSAGTSICEALLDHGIEIEHACDQSRACTTCHCIVRKGFDSLNEVEEREDDLLDRAWGLEAQSRLSCQAIVAGEDLTIEIPRYTINHAKENR
ncbi:2Fe-2S ferredoxin [Cupriavidus sp. UYMSc13B]|nr:2Fe-2S ferredoxin [Cupriavidus sp. UYMSc13B]